MPVLLHTDTPIVAPKDPVTPESALEGFSVGDRVGNPLYTIVDEHILAALVLIAAPLLIWLAGAAIRRLADRDHAWAVMLADAYDSASLTRRVASWSIGISAVIHGALVFGHELSWYTALYTVGAGFLAVVAVWTIRDRHSRLAAAAVVGSIVTFWFLGIPVDQLGIAMKLLELFALALLAVPQLGDGRIRRLRPASLVMLVVFTGHGCAIHRAT
jgi:hypothetical protein